MLVYCLEIFHFHSDYTPYNSLRNQPESPNSNITENITLGMKKRWVKPLFQAPGKCSMSFPVSFLRCIVMRFKGWKSRNHKGLYHSTFTWQHITLNITAGLNDSQNWTNIDSYKNDLRSKWNLERRKIMSTLINNYMRSVGIETMQMRVHIMLTCIGCQHTINGVRSNCNHMVSWSNPQKTKLSLVVLFFSPILLYSSSSFF